MSPPTNPRNTRHVCLALLAIALALPSFAADDSALRRDLTAVVALLGLPCGQVVAATTVSDSEHVATCQDGNRYRVFIDAQGRVVAQKQ